MKNITEQLNELIEKKRKQEARKKKKREKLISDFIAEGTNPYEGIEPISEELLEILKAFEEMQEALKNAKAAI